MWRVSQAVALSAVLASALMCPSAHRTACRSSGAARTSKSASEQQCGGCTEASNCKRAAISSEQQCEALLRGRQDQRMMTLTAEWHTACLWRARLRRECAHSPEQPYDVGPVPRRFEVCGTQVPGNERARLHCRRVQIHCMYYQRRHGPGAQPASARACANEY